MAAKAFTLNKWQRKLVCWCESAIDRPGYTASPSD